jgi:hypothetical protein
MKSTIAIGSTQGPLNYFEAIETLIANNKLLQRLSQI